MSPADTAVMEQVSFETAELAADLAANRKPRSPRVPVHEVSGSMAAAPIEDLNRGLAAFRDELAPDVPAMRQVAVAIVPFGPAQVALPSTGVGEFQLPALTAPADTPLAAAITSAITSVITQATRQAITQAIAQAITQAIERVRARKAVYLSHRIAHDRPWIVLITDGAPTGAWQAVLAAVHEGAAGRAFASAFFAIRLCGAGMQVLRGISLREPLGPAESEFRALFAWLSASRQSVSRLTPRAEVPRAAPPGWTSV